MVKTVEYKGLLGVLHKQGKLSGTDIERVKGVQQETGQRDWQILLQLGIVSEEDLRDARGLYTDLPVWEKKRSEKYPRLDTLPSNFLRMNKILPLALSNGRLDVAIAHPAGRLFWCRELTRG